MPTKKTIKPTKSAPKAISNLLPARVLVFIPGHAPQPPLSAKEPGSEEEPVPEQEMEALGQSRMVCGYFEPSIGAAYNDLPPKTQKPGIFSLLPELHAANSADIMDEISSNVAVIDVGLKETVRQVFKNPTMPAKYHWPLVNPRLSFTICFTPSPNAGQLVNPSPKQSGVAGPSETPYTNDEEPPENEQIVPPSTPDSNEARLEFSRLVDSIAAEREDQAVRLQPALNSYLRQWDDEQQRLTREKKGRPADEIAKAKQELVNLVTAALERLDLAIYRDGQPCKLTVPVDDDHRRGTFWLTPRGVKNPVDHKANLSDLFNLGGGEPEIGLTTPRREALVEWRAKLKASQRSNRSK